jgi:hypothetical protein
MMPRLPMTFSSLRYYSVRGGNRFNASHSEILHAVKQGSQIAIAWFHSIGISFELDHAIRFNRG